MKLIGLALSASLLGLALTSCSQIHQCGVIKGGLVVAKTHELEGDEPELGHHPERWTVSVKRDGCLVPLNITHAQFDEINVGEQYG